MPELPEVETVRRGLAKLLPGRVVKRVKVFESPKSFPNEPVQVEHFLYGAKVVAVRRRAKVLLIELDTNYSLVIHLKMTGQLVFRHGVQHSDQHAPTSRVGVSFKENYSLRDDDFAGGHPNDSLIGTLPDRSTRVEVVFTDGSHLYFNDQRKFGWIKLVPSAEVMVMPFFQKVGPEPLDPMTTDKECIQRIRRRNGSYIKAAILDQSVIAGVGNIYADEALWAAQIHPQTRVRDVTDEELAKVFHEVRAVLRLSIEKGGSTDKNYVDAEGRRGSYLSFANVFRREGQPCHRHPDVCIEKLKVVGRGTHICPACQVKK